MAGDKQVREQITGPRPAMKLTAAESWQLLAGGSLGRIVFTQHLLQPWADGQRDYVIAVEAQLITGLRLAGWCR